MTAEIIDLALYRRLRFSRQEIRVDEKDDYVCIPAPLGGFAWFPRSEFTAQELEDIDYMKRECGCP